MLRRLGRYELSGVLVRAYAAWLAASAGCSAGASDSTPELWGFFTVAVKANRTGARWSTELVEGWFTPRPSQDVANAQKSPRRDPPGLLQLISASAAGATHVVQGYVSSGTDDCLDDVCDPYSIDKLEDLPPSFVSSSMSIPITPEIVELRVLFAGRIVGRWKRPDTSPRIALREVRPPFQGIPRRGVAWRVEPSQAKTLWVSTCTRDPCDVMHWRSVRSIGQDHAQGRHRVNFQIAATDGFQRVHDSLVLPGNGLLPDP